MRAILRYKTLAFAALILWLFASWSGAHGHWCFDGQEPPISVHMDILADHPEHHADEQHTDADVDPGQLTLAKLVKLDLALLLAAALLLTLLLVNSALAISRYTSHYPIRLFGLRPPLRAPPFLPA